MAKEEIGKLVTCNRCGTKIFLRFIGETNLDGGFTKINNFEPLPPEWLWITDYGLLCDNCAGQLRDKVHDFLGDDATSKWKHPLNATTFANYYVQTIIKENENET